ncbi:MAG: site-specific integrase [Prolixibacteraceae bacterium]
MKYDLSILFYAKKGKLDKKGEMPIYLRITVNGQRAEITTNRKVDKFKWDSALQRIKGRSEEARTLNTHLDHLENLIKRAYNTLEEKGEDISADILRDMLIGKNQKNYYLIPAFEKNNELVEQEEGEKYSRSTIDQYKTTLDRLKLFLQLECNCNDIELSKLDVLFIRRFEIFLQTKYLIKHNTIMKHLKQLKKVIHFCMQMGYIDKDPFMQHKTAFKQFSRDFLTQDELSRIENHNFSRIKRLDRVKDVFLFVCYTGLSYSDLFELTPEGITKGIDGKNWVIYEREKTGVRASIPIIPTAQAIIDKYKDDPACQIENKLIPVISNQRLNSYLTEIAVLCEINKNITMHIGRHTFATTVTLTHGVPIETVSKMLGHKSIITTMIYSKVVDTKISKDMEALSTKLSIQTENSIDLTPISNIG